MKTLSKQQMKSVGRKIVLFSIAAVLATSCGSDDNKNETNSAVSGTNVGNNSPIFGNPNTGGGSGNLQQWESLKSQTQCQQGRMTDQTFTVQGQNYGGYYGYGYTTGQNSPDVVNGQMASGSVSGTTQGVYYGKSCNGDLIFISKVTNGNQVAYNIATSFCNYGDHYGQYIGDNAGMTNFSAMNVQLNNGNVSSGIIQFASPAYGQYVPVNFQSVNGGCY